MKYVLKTLLFMSVMLHGYEQEDLAKYSATALADVLLGKTPEVKVRYCEEILSRTAEEINSLPSFQQNVILNICANHKRLWMRYVAGYMQLHHKELGFGASEAQTLNGIEICGISNAEQMELSRKYHLISPQRFDSLVAGFVARYEKYYTTTYWFKFIPFSQENTKATYCFRLIDEDTGVVLLDKNIGSLFEPEIQLNRFNKNRLEIVSKDQTVCPIINLGHYYEALKFYPKASINDYIFYMNYASKQYYDWNISLTSA